MKVLFATAIYPDFEDWLERQSPCQPDESYEDIKQRYYDSLFSDSDFYSRNGRNLGWEADDVIVNFHKLQTAWAQRHRPSLAWLCRLARRLPGIRRVYAVAGNPLVLLEQVRRYRPDILYVQCMFLLPPPLARLLKRYCGRLVGYMGSKLPPDRYFAPYDLIVSIVPDMVAHVRRLGLPAEHFRLAFDPIVLSRIHPTPSRYDVTHVGGYGPIHAERNRILEYAAGHCRIDFWGYGMDNLAPDSPIRRNFHGEAWGREMFEILASGKITVTAHITKVAGDCAANMTLYEATGCGTLLLCDRKKNLGELFEVGEEVVAYDSPEDLSDKIRYYLKHEDERLRIAQAGQRRTLAEHTYAHRMMDLDRIFRLASV